MIFIGGAMQLDDVKSQRDAIVLDGVLTTDLRDTSPMLQPAAIVPHGFAGEAAAASQRSAATDRYGIAATLSSSCFPYGRCKARVAL
jgi:hypothetical protein